VARLSEYFGWRERVGIDPPRVACRPVRKQEIEAALRLILADENGLAGDEAVLDFLAIAVQRQMDLNQIWVAKVGQQMVWALLPMASPGRTMLLLTPPLLFGGTPVEAPRMLAEAVCAHWRNLGVQLAQLLLPPGDAALQTAYGAGGFEVLAELIYLQRAVGREAEVGLAAGFKLHNYSERMHQLFAEAIVRSYEGSFDCPTLNGRRNIEDVIAGHKGTGVFDPTAWHVVSRDGRACGVLILSPAPHNEVVELVYLGLAPEARGQGLGDALMRLAMTETQRLERSELSLAVDARNLPALRLYYRHGLRRVASRVALLRDLRSAAVAGKHV
jgi:ribosomal protein S18 acetylase RimI-like enzyme